MWSTLNTLSFEYVFEDLGLVFVKISHGELDVDIRIFTIEDHNKGLQLNITIKDHVSGSQMNL